MSSKRRTFHVDWDSPSAETGTVKRRPTSLTATFLSTPNCFENVEYYEVRNFIGGFDLRLLDTPEDLPTELIPEIREIPGRAVLEEKKIIKRDLTVKDNGSSLTGFEKIAGEEDKDRKKDKRIVGFGESKQLDDPKVKVRNCDHETKVSVELQPEKRTSKLAVRKHFGLKLCKDPLLWKSAKPTKNSSAWRNSPLTPDESSGKSSRGLQRRSAIPKPKLTRSGSSKGRGLVNSSSESSGIGSPLSPLSPLQKETTTCCADPEPPQDDDRLDRPITSSGSKSSGFGTPDSPDSPLSPDSQQYAAFYLIQQQLEKLHNCPCERRQAQVGNCKYRMVHHGV